MQHLIFIENEGYSGINPVEFGYFKCPKSYTYGPVVRTFWVIHFVVSGKGYFTTNGKRYSIHAGEMFVTTPYIESIEEADSENPWNYIWIGFTCDTQLPAQLPDVMQYPEAISIFDTMKECENNSNGRSAFLCARLWDLFSLILGKEEKRKDYIKQSLSIIHSEYMNEISVEKIAKQLNIDRTYFSVAFKKAIGQPPKQYILSYRMNIAASMMVNNNISVSVTAYSVGYPDIFSFSKMFKKYFGMSPTEYLKIKKES